jgi:hypothetical protein
MSDTPVIKIKAEFPDCGELEATVFYSETRQKRILAMITEMIKGEDLGFDETRAKPFSKKHDPFRLEVD